MKPVFLQMWIWLDISPFSLSFFRFIIVMRLSLALLNTSTQARATSAGRVLTVQLTVGAICMGSVLVVAAARVTRRPQEQRAISAHWATTVIQRMVACVHRATALAMVCYIQPCFLVVYLLTPYRHASSTRFVLCFWQPLAV